MLSAFLLGSGGGLCSFVSVGAHWPLSGSVCGGATAMCLLGVPVDRGGVVSAVLGALLQAWLRVICFAGGSGGVVLVVPCSVEPQLADALPHMPRSCP